ncbi:MAG TPA: response regulator, partial [Dehalococcoidia bacterium]|nr:response regulator [Dehalococcoidia bacterium]
MTIDSNTIVNSTDVPILQKNILIIEDENVFARAVQKKLTRAGYICEVAGSLANAWEMYKKTTPDLILLDMRLPDGSGLEFLEGIREKEKAQV